MIEGGRPSAIDGKIRRVRATRYLTVLREGGSLPAIVEADDDGTYVLKFRGAGQGPKALIAELVAGQIGGALGQPVPELVLVDLDPTIGRSEPDSEIQYLIKSSAGLNLALDYLPGAFGFDPAAWPKVDPALASAIVWFDAYVTNVDRTARNTNLLVWHRRLWLIDHGASLYFHHAWVPGQADTGTMTRSQAPFAAIKHHVLLRQATEIAQADAAARKLLSPELLRGIIAMIPDEWLEAAPGQDDTTPASPEVTRQAYAEHLIDRLASATFVEEAERAHAILG